MSTQTYLSYVEKLHTKESDQAFLKGTRGGEIKEDSKLDDLDDTGEPDDEEAENYAINA